MSARTAERAEEGRRELVKALDAVHRLNNSLAGIANYASLATASLKRQILSEDLGAGAFAGVLADVARIGDAARCATMRGDMPTDDVADAGPDLGTDGAGSTSGGPTVLLVDDDSSVRDSAGRLLQLEGYAVIEAGDADAALAISAAHPGKIDLLLTDFTMPGGGGRVLRVAIGRGRPDTKVLFMTGCGPAARDFLDDQESVIRKPFSAGELYRKVAEVLSGDS